MSQKTKNTTVRGKTSEKPPERGRGRRFVRKILYKIYKKYLKISLKFSKKDIDFRGKM